MSDSKLANYPGYAVYTKGLFYLMFLMESKVPDYVTILSPAHFICQFGNCYSGKAYPILCMLSDRNFKFGKNLGISTTIFFKTAN